MLYIAIFIISVFIASLSQTMLKSSADKEHDNLIKEYLNIRVIAAYILFFTSTILTTIAYKQVPLSLGAVLETSGYVFVAVLGYFFLHEKIGKQKLRGLAVILVGIFVFNL